MNFVIFNVLIIFTLSTSVQNAFLGGTIPNPLSAGTSPLKSAATAVLDDGKSLLANFNPVTTKSTSTGSSSSSSTTFNINPSTMTTILDSSKSSLATTTVDPIITNPIFPNINNILAVTSALPTNNLVLEGTKSSQPIPVIVPTSASTILNSILENTNSIPTISTASEILDTITEEIINEASTLGSNSDISPIVPSIINSILDSTKDILTATNIGDEILSSIVEASNIEIPAITIEVPPSTLTNAILENSNAIPIDDAITTAIKIPTIPALSNLTNTIEILGNLVPSLPNPLSSVSPKIPLPEKPMSLIDRLLALIKKIIDFILGLFNIG